MTASNGPDNPPAMPQETVAQLFERWKQGLQNDGIPSADELYAEHPQLADELKRMIDAYRELQLEWDTDFADSVQQVLRGLPVADGGAIDLQSQLVDLTFHAPGGLGVVYRGTDADLGREVAIKFMQPRLHGDSISRAQFEAEAAITGRLEHPGIVPVYGLGKTSGGGLFYAMQFVYGEAFDETIKAYHAARLAGPHRDTHAQLRKLLTHFVAVCNTIAYAHNRGIVHCDIKPRNVMLGKYGETIVLDWGSARPAPRDAAEKASGEQTLVLDSTDPAIHDRVTGTLYYMSPEQAAGSTQLNKSTDVFSLGATLFAILTGTTAYTASSMPEVRQQIIRGAIRPPRDVNRQVSPAIEAICLKAMAIEPADRYATALELAEDVSRYLADEPVACYPDPWSRRAARWVRRHHRTAQIGAIALIAIAVITALFLAVQARLTSQEQLARARGLMGRARLAADSLSYEMDRRFWALSEAARDLQLAPMLQAAIAAHEPPRADSPLNQWLEKVAATSAKNLPAYSWFISANDGEGTQIARYPALNQDGQLAPSLGKPFAKRDYFHGRGRELNEASFNEIKPLTKPHLSPPFRGTRQQGSREPYLVAFSVPIWGPDGQKSDPIGVLSTSVQLGQLTAVEQNAVMTLVFMQPDYVDRDASGVPAEGRGLVLHHPGMGKFTPTERALRIEPATLAVVQSLMDVDPMGDRFHPIRNQQDVLGAQLPEYSGNWMVGAAAVTPPSQVDRAENTGWVVLIEERP